MGLWPLAGAKPAFAQATEDRIYEEPERETEAEKRAGEAAEEAERLQVGDTGAAIPYDEILAHPDDLRLNFRYAHQQVLKGNLKGAAATLERILLIDPGQLEVRLFYAVVLFRLDALDEAEREFNSVLAQNPPPSMRGEAESFLSQIALRQKRTRFTASLSIGWHFDTNRDAAPEGKQRRIFGGLINVAGGRRDTGWLGIANVSVVHDLGFQEPHNVFASFTYFLDKQRDLNTLNIESFLLNLGATYRTPWFDLIPLASATQLRLDEETFLRVWLYGLRAEREFTPLFRAYIQGRQGYQNFHPIRTNQAARLRKGPFWDVTIGGAYALFPNQQIALDITHHRKFAKQSFNGFKRAEFAVTHTWLLGGGQFIMSRLTMG